MGVGLEKVPFKQLLSLQATKHIEEGLQCYSELGGLPIFMAVFRRDWMAKAGDSEWTHQQRSAVTLLSAVRCLVCNETSLLLRPLYRSVCLPQERLSRILGAIFVVTMYSGGGPARNVDAEWYSDLNGIVPTNVYGNQFTTDRKEGFWKRTFIARPLQVV